MDGSLQLPELSSISPDKSAAINAGFQHLQSFRRENHLSTKGIWNDRRLQVAACGAPIYREIHEKASPQLVEVLQDPSIMQNFTGVRPTVNLSRMVPKLKIEEFRKVLLGLRNPFIHIKRITLRHPFAWGTHDEMILPDAEHRGI